MIFKKFKLGTLASFSQGKQVDIDKQMLHVKIETTLYYATVSQNNVKLSHRKYIG